MNAVTADYTITRAFAAPSELVYRAWTTPAHFGRWFGPRDFTVPEDRIVMELRPGGAWQVVMLDGAGGEYPLGGVYRELDAPRRLVFTTGDPDNTTGDIASTVTVTFTPTGDGGTEMTMRQQGVNTDQEHAEGAKNGWLMFLDRLAEHLATMTEAADR
ncbi:SRPBCC family protein [Streptosporangium sandarakinum]